MGELKFQKLTPTQEADLSGYSIAKISCGKSEIIDTKEKQE